MSRTTAALHHPSQEPVLPHSIYCDPVPVSHAAQALSPPPTSGRASSAPLRPPSSPPTSPPTSPPSSPPTPKILPASPVTCPCRAARRPCAASCAIRLRDPSRPGARGPEPAGSEAAPRRLLARYRGRRLHPLSVTRAPPAAARVRLRRRRCLRLRRYPMVPRVPRIIDSRTGARIIAYPTIYSDETRNPKQ